MELRETLERRRMRRAFTPCEIDPDLVSELFVESLRAPTAGNSRGISWVTLLGNHEVARYFEAATDEAWRQSSPRYEGLRHAGAIGICVANPETYRERYAEPDKARSGLGASIEAWPVPYWIGDAGAASLAALLLIEDAGLAACFLGAFRNDQALRAELDLRAHEVIYGAVLLGLPSDDDHRSASLTRPGPSRADRVRRIAPRG